MSRLLLGLLLHATAFAQEAPALAPAEPAPADAVPGEPESPEAAPAEPSPADVPVEPEPAPPPNVPPTVTVPSVSPAEPTIADALSCGGGEATDPDGDALARAVSFSIGGAPAAQGDTLPAGQLAKGDVVTCTVAVSDGTHTTTVTSAPVTVRNSPPVVVAASLTPASPRTDDALRCEAGPTHDADGDPVTLAVGWLVDGAPIDATDPVLPADRTTKGDRVGCAITPTDGESPGVAVASAVVTVADTPPVLAAVALTPPGARKGDAIACTPGEATDADGDPVTFRTKWTVDGAPVEAKGSLVAPRRGAVVGCAVTPFDGVLEGPPVEAAPVTVANTPPRAGTVRVTPTSPRVADTLTCAVDGLADADGDPVTPSFAWTVDGAPAGEGATLAGVFRKGQTVACVATPHDGAEPGAPTAPGSVVVVDTPPVVTAVSVSPADPDTEAVLVATAEAADADGDPVALSWRWTVNGKAAAGIDDRLDGVRSFAHGDSVVAAATATAAGAKSKEVLAPPVVVRNTPPTRPRVALEDPSEAGGALVCRVVEPATDLDADPIAYEFSWTLDGRDTAAKGQTDHKGDTVLPAAIRLGQEWTCRATATDGRDRGPASEVDHLVIVEPQAAMGSSHACAIGADGFVTCWGNRDYGLVDAPAERLRQLAVGAWHNCGIRQDDLGVTCWGHDVYGQSRPPDGAFREVAAGGWHTCALDLDGRVACWGQASGGRLVAPDGSFTALAAGGKHTCALDVAGSVRCWGADDSGQSSPPPGPFRQVSAGDEHTCALDAAGAVTCWGAGDAGELQAPPGPFVQVVTGSRFSCALRADGTVSCWGFGDYGQLEVPAGTFRRLGHGVDGLCGVTVDNAVRCWGRDQHGAATPPESLR